MRSIVTDNMPEHPHAALLREAQREREICDSPKAQALLEAVFSAVKAYSDFLERNDLIWVPDAGSAFEMRLKAQALVVTVDYGVCPGGTIDVTLKDGAIDRVYGNGKNPDPDGRGPPDIPHKQRPEFPYDFED
jgi:hypothetical protein